MAIINVDDAYILNETGAQVDKTTGIPFKNESLTEAEAAQARANIRAGGSNPNLLDNAYFVGGGSQLGDGVFPINQRGQTSYTGLNYTIDRWIIASSAITVSLNAGYLELSGTAGSNFSQVIAPERVKGLYGKTVTASALMYDGTIISGTGIFPTVPASGWDYVGFVYGTDIALICGTNLAGRSEFFLQTLTSSAKVCAVKLELGTVSTLANDVPPDFGEELRKCQRYLWRKAFPANTVIGSGLTFNTATIYDVVLPVAMRSGGNPTITTTSSLYVVYNGTYALAGTASGITILDNHLRLTMNNGGADYGTLNHADLLISYDTTITIANEL